MRDYIGETDPDYEFVLSNGVIHVSRFVGLSVMDQLARIGAKSFPRHLQIGKKGVLESLRWVTLPQPTLPRKWLF
jgi:hypothetical protein